jgi:LPS export ABC transporter protein LptC
MFSPRVRRLTLSSVLATLLFLEVGCRQTPTPQSETPAVETGLTLENASLEQADEDGNLVWKIQAQRVFYSDDRQRADLENITGNLYSQGEVVLQVRAETGEIIEDGEKIRLKDNVTAIDPRNDAVLKGSQLEWIPAEDLVTMAGGLEGKDPNLMATADQGRYLITEERLELTGSVEATAKEPPLQLKTETIVWEIPQKRVVSPEAIKVSRYEGDTITERVKARQATVDLASQTVSLQQDGQLVALDPPVQITTDAALWNLESETVVISQPVQIVHTGEQITVQGNEGRADLKNQVVRLQGKVLAANSQQSNRLAAEQLTWELSTQAVQAQGNVIYQQTADPPLILKGSRASGNLTAETLEVTGEGGESRVVTEITP